MTRKERDELYDAFLKELSQSEAKTFSKYIKEVINAAPSFDEKGLTEAIKNTPLPERYAEKVAFIARLLLVFDGVKDERFTLLADAYNPLAVVPYARFVLKQFDADKTPAVIPRIYLATLPNERIGFALPKGREIVVEMPRIATPIEIGRVAGTYARMGLSEENIRTRLIKQFGSAERAVRTARTEAHVQIEEEKLEQAAASGIKYKIWRTQRDDDVRATPFHDLVADQRVGIRDAFNFAGMKAWAPGDFRLPAGERINCRCYLEYE